MPRTANASPMIPMMAAADPASFSSCMCGNADTLQTCQQCDFSGTKVSNNLTNSLLHSSPVGRNTIALPAARLHTAELRFHFHNPLIQPSFNLRHRRTLAEMSRLVKVLNVGAQFLQEFLGKSGAHRPLILHIPRCKRKITVFWSPPTPSTTPPFGTCYDLSTRLQGVNLEA